MNLPDADDRTRRRDARDRYFESDEYRRDPNYGWYRPDPSLARDRAFDAVGWLLGALAVAAIVLTIVAQILLHYDAIPAGWRP